MIPRFGYEGAGDLLKSTGALMAAMTVAFLSACSSGQETSSEPSTGPTPLDRRLSPEILREVEAALDCDDVRYLQDDVYFHDSMKGLYCVPEIEGGHGAEFRIYEEPESPAQTLDEQEGIVGEQTKLLFGVNWYAVGDVRQLESISDAIGVEPILWSTTPEAMPETEREGMLDSCATATVTLTRSRVVKSAESVSKDSLNSAEKYFPGIEKSSRNLADEIVHVNPRINDTDFEFVITEYGPRIKRFCRSVVRE